MTTLSRESPVNVHGPAIFSGFMMRSLLLVALFLVSCRDDPVPEKKMPPITPENEVPGKTITLEYLRDMFAQISENTDWDVSGELLWGYFFTNDEKAGLEPVRDELVEGGYRFVDLYRSEPNEQDGSRFWWLHVEKEEIHTPESLDARNDALTRLAIRHRVDSYDGMDVGPIHTPSEKDNGAPNGDPERTPK